MVKIITFAVACLLVGCKDNTSPGPGAPSVEVDQSTSAPTASAGPSTQKATRDPSSAASSSNTPTTTLTPDVSTADPGAVDSEVPIIFEAAEWIPVAEATEYVIESDRDTPNESGSSDSVEVRLATQTQV